MTWSIALFLFSFSSILHARSEELRRPEIWGIAKVTLLVSDIGSAREYYGRFLCFSEAFSYDSAKGRVTSFKVNDRQFLEFILDPQAKSKERLVSFSLETENVEQMRQYLKQQGQQVPDKTTIDGAGNEVFLIHDPYGNPIEFIHFLPDGLHKKSAGQFLSEQRISKRIHHVGLYSDKVIENDPFYVGLLGFVEIVRLPEDRKIPPALLYLGTGDSIENIEFYATAQHDFVHPCFLVEDMQQTIYTLKERKTTESLAKPMIGRGKRWLLNLRDRDNNGVEFTEAHTVR
jgi:catechol 2,3-dioxygenase-like lactoylglutathione lyase family enzyme